MRAKRPRIIDGITVWQCSTCREWLLPEAFYPDKRTSNGLKSQCKACHTACAIRSRDQDRKRGANREHMRRARQRNPAKFRRREREAAQQREWNERREARRQLNNAVRRGDVVRPEQCQHCGFTGPVEGHHPDYSKPLDVEWLCTLCHGKEHHHAA